VKLIDSLTQINRIRAHRNIFVTAMVILVLGLPLSPFLVSFGQMILLLNWIVEGGFNVKLRLIKEQKILWAFLLMPLLHIIWLLNTSDFQYALHDLKIKIPLLIIPIIIGTSEHLKEKELRYILSAFVFAVFAGSMVSLAVLLDIYHVDINDVRNISIFISYIRFSLMVVLSILIIYDYITTYFDRITSIQKLGLFILLVWFIVFIILLQSITGWVSLFIILIISYLKAKNKHIKYIVGLLILLILSIFGITATHVYKDFYNVKRKDLKNLPEYTLLGNKYTNDTIYKDLENGYYINILICKKELRQTWSELSDISFDKYDVNGFRIQKTMIRYLTSKGLTKDREGLLSLDNKDIKMIEKGYTSCMYRYKSGLYIRMYVVLWELNEYIKTGDANGKSIAQRIEFSKAAFHIIKNNFWFGVGVGDLNKEYKKAYIEIDSKLEKKHRLRVHNQYITFLLTFGIFGFILAVYSMLYPGIVSLKRENVLLLGFLLIILMSMLNEDTLETQAGVTFYILFYTLFVFTKQNSDG